MGRLDGFMIIIQAILISAGNGECPFAVLGMVLDLKCTINIQ